MSDQFNNRDLPFRLGQTVEDGVLLQKFIERPLTVDVQPIQTGEYNLTTDTMLQKIKDKGYNIDHIICCQNNGKSCFNVTFKDLKAKELFLITFEKFKCNDAIYTSAPSVPLDLEVKRDHLDISIFGIPYELSDDIVTAKISKYADVQFVRRQTFKNFPNIQSGVRVVRVKNISKPIPSKLYIKGIMVSTKYTGQIQGKKCYNCGIIGLHLADNCPYKVNLQSRTDDTPEQNTCLKELGDITSVTTMEKQIDMNDMVEFPPLDPSIGPGIEELSQQIIDQIKLTGHYKDDHSDDLTQLSNISRASNTQDTLNSPSSIPGTQQDISYIPDQIECQTAQTSINEYLDADISDIQQHIMSSLNSTPQSEQDETHIQQDDEVTVTQDDNNHHLMTDTSDSDQEYLDTSDQFPHNHEDQLAGSSVDQAGACTLIPHLKTCTNLKCFYVFQV